MNASMTGALVCVAVLAIAGLLASSLAFGSDMSKVLGSAVVLALVAIRADRAGRRSLFFGALISSAGLALVAIRLIESAERDRDWLGVAGATLGACIVSAWWVSDRRRGRRALQTHLVLVTIVVALILFAGARSTGQYIQERHSLGCRVGIDQALLQGGVSLLSGSMLLLLETCCWRKRALTGERGA